MKKKFKVLLGVVIIVIIAAVAFIQGSSGLQANLLEVKPGEIARSFKEEGTVIAGGEYPVYTVYGGRITDLPVAEGEQVEKGELLASFDSTELTYQLEQLKGQLKSIQAQQELEKARISPEKMKELYEAGAISQKEYEDAVNTVNSQYYPGQTEALTAQIEMVQYQIDQSSVYAPAAGVIAQLDVKQGIVTVPGQQVMTIISPDDYQVEVYVLTQDIAKITPGMQVELIQDNKDEDLVFPGIVEKIAPAAVEKTSALGLTEQRIKVTVLPDVPESLQLLPGFALDVQFTTQKQKDRLVIPKTALFPYQDGDALWVVEEGKARLKRVKCGFENDREVVIEDGLESGDLVILNPQLEGLKEGKRIKVE